MDKNYKIMLISCLDATEDFLKQSKPNQNPKSLYDDFVKIMGEYDLVGIESYIVEDINSEKTNIDFSFYPKRSNWCATYCCIGCSWWRKVIARGK